MFRGTSYHTIDAKGRILIPARFRDEIEAGGKSIMVTRWDNCLWAYTATQWTEVESKILGAPATGDQMRRFKRFFIGGATDCSTDKQGRILIPPTLRSYAALEKQIAIVGVLDRFEIWSRQRLDDEEQQIQLDREDTDFKNKIAELGF